MFWQLNDPEPLEPEEMLANRIRSRGNDISTFATRLGAARKISDLHNCPADHLHIYVALPALGEWNSLFPHMRSADAFCPCVANIPVLLLYNPTLNLVTVSNPACHCPSLIPALPVHDGGPMLRVRSQFKDDEDVYTSINEINDRLRPVVQKFLEDFRSQRHFDIWMPPATADSTTHRFYEGLGIPLIEKRAGKGPSLLLHNLGKEPNVYADKLFAIKRNR